MAKRESTLLMMWGGLCLWAGIVAAMATIAWMLHDLSGVPETASLLRREIVAERLILAPCCLIVSLLGGITYRLSQAS
jgi:hypothetical protein